MVTLFLLETSIVVPHGGMSLPLKIDFSDYIPVETLTLEITFTNTDLGLKLSSYLSDLEVSSDDPKALILI